MSIPTELGVIVQANFKTSSFIPSGSTRVTGPIRIQFEPILTPLFLGKGEVSADVDGVLAEFPERGKLDTRLDLSLNLFKFESVVAQLRRGSWAVPAPFHVLKGNAEVRVEGQASLQEGLFPYTVKTRLESKAQSVDLDGSGKLSFVHTADSFKPHVDFDLILSDIKLALPRLDLAVPPRLFPDSRIRKTAQWREEHTEKSGPSAFSYQGTIRTPPDKPVFILSNLSKDPVPIHLDLSIGDSAPLAGKIQIRNYPVELFRRKATVENLALMLESPTKLSPIQGSVKISYADYVVTVTLGGTIEKPLVHLTSEPPLPENQLIAVLLFGQPLEELDQEQSDSVGNTRAAFAEGAVGLASLYVLASTPIQSINYDPESRSISAKIRLGDGTSLTLGSDTGGALVGLRRRLSSSWSVETDLTNVLNTGGVASAYLQWSRKY
jgi:hypothetical protein